MLNKFYKILFGIGGSFCVIISKTITILGGFADLIGLAFSSLGRGCSWVSRWLEDFGDELICRESAEIETVESEVA